MRRSVLIVMVLATLALSALGAEARGQTGEAPLRRRPLGQTIALVGLFGIVAGLGLLFARPAGREPDEP